MHKHDNDSHDKKCCGKHHGDRRTQHRRMDRHNEGAHERDRRCRHHHDAEHHDHSRLFRGRKFTSEDIQLLLRHFINQDINYGYELIKQFGQLTSGFYSPSPGVIYPALTYLEEMGDISSNMEGTRKRYTLSQTGKDFLEKNKEGIDRLLAILARLSEKMQSVTEAMNEDRERKVLSPELMQSMHNFRHLLHEQHNADVEKQAKIAQIIDDAIKQISALN